MPLIVNVSSAPFGVSIVICEPWLRWWSFENACEMNPPSGPRVSSVACEPDSQFSLKTLLDPGCTAVNVRFSPRILASPARTPDTAVAPGAARAASSTLTGKGSKLF